MKKNAMMVTAALIVLLVMSCEKKNVRDVIDFEELQTGPSGFWNGSDGSGGFTSGNAVFPNFYNNEWQTWSGFAYSNHTDATTPGYENMYSSVAGSGAGGSAKYGIYNFFMGRPDTLRFIVPEKVTRISVSNSTYAYFAMRDGDAFSKKFGGASGSDPDWFKLVITALNNRNEATATAEIFLADFRFDNNSLDYISNVWNDIDLSRLGFVSALVFEIASSDTGQWGINTPAYVCVDNIEGVIKTPND